MVTLADFLEQHLFACVFRSLTGLDCPGCGLQRAFIALLRGDIVASFEHNAALIPFVITAIYTAFHLKFSFRSGARNILAMFIFTVSLMIVNFIARLPNPL